MAQGGSGLKAAQGLLVASAFRRKEADMNGRELVAAIAVAALCAGAGAQPPAGTQTAVPNAAEQSALPARIYIRAGLKTHGPGQHDYPQLLADWSKVLTERGALVDGSLHFPTAAELASTDGMVRYKGDAGTLAAE